MHYVYVLKSEADKKLYIGQTNDLRRRFIEHKHGLNKSTKNRIPFSLIYYEAYKSRLDALARERNLKKFKKTYSELKKRISA